MGERVRVSVQHLWRVLQNLGMRLKKKVHCPTFLKNCEPGAPLHRLSGLQMENRIDSYSCRKESLLLGLHDGLEILTDFHSQPEVSLIARRNCGRDRLG